MTTRMHRVIQHRTAVAGIEAISLCSNHAFPRHSHDEFGIGLLVVGVQKSWSAVGEIEAGSGDAIMVNPGEIHDGRPVDGQAREWRMLYLDPVLLRREAAEDVLGEIEIARPMAQDAILAQLFARLFDSVTSLRPDDIAVEEDLLRMLMHVLQHHSFSPPQTGGPTPAVRTALRRLDLAPEVAVSLAELAVLSGASRFQLLRGFAREVGMTPHAYLIQRRVRLARRLLTQGRSPIQAAYEAGFADQSHMTRAFVRQFGTTPSRYQSALA